MVATTFGGSREVVEDGASGFIENPFDVAAYAGRIAELLRRDPRARGPWGRRAGLGSSGASGWSVWPTNSSRSTPAAEARHRGAARLEGGQGADLLQDSPEILRSPGRRYRLLAATLDRRSRPGQAPVGRRAGCDHRAEWIIQGKTG